MPYKDPDLPHKDILNLLKAMGSVCFIFLEFNTNAHHVCVESSDPNAKGESFFDFIINNYLRIRNGRLNAVSDKPKTDRQGRIQIPYMKLVLLL